MRHVLTQRIHLSVIPLEQVEERRLRACRAPYPPETERPQSELELFDVEQKVL